MDLRALKAKQRASPTQQEHLSSGSTLTLPDNLQMQTQKPGMVIETSSLNRYELL